MNPNAIKMAAALQGNIKFNEAAAVEYLGPPVYTGPHMFGTFFRTQLPSAEDRSGHLHLSSGMHMSDVTTGAQNVIGLAWMHTLETT
jgi:hypothetical protein